MQKTTSHAPYWTVGFGTRTYATTSKAAMLAAAVASQRSSAGGVTIGDYCEMP
nr:hypothetical protein [Haloarcula amylolytica]